MAKAGILKLGAWRGIAALLFLLIAAYAVLPTAPALDRPATGSAFSAATSDVAIGCGNRIDVARKAVADKPVPHPAPCPIITELRPQQATAAGRIYLALNVRAPPAPRILSPQSSPRAPPAA